MAKQAALVAQRCGDANENGKLDLSDCDLSKVPEGIFMLTKSATITSVDFSRNKLRRLAPLVAEKYPDLTKLSLCQNFLLDLPQSVDLLAGLRHLDLSWNSLLHIPAVVFRLPKLEKLNLQQNQITKVPLAEMMNMKSLKSVHLEQNPLTQDCIQQLSNLSSENGPEVYL